MSKIFPLGKKSAFHNEIVSFCRLMEPRIEEMDMRKELVARFTDLVNSTFRECKIEVFGSQATGLCLPTSDIDIAIQGTKKHGHIIPACDPKQKREPLKCQAG